MTSVASKRAIPAVVLIAAVIFGWIVYRVVQVRQETGGQGQAARPSPV